MVYLLFSLTVDPSWLRGLLRVELDVGVSVRVSLSRRTFWVGEQVPADEVGDVGSTGDYLAISLENSKT